MKNNLPFRRHVRLFALAAAGCLVAPATSLAGVENVITTDVSRLSEAASYSRDATTSPARPALLAIVGYQVVVANVGGNTTNNVRVRGSAATVPGESKLRFSSAEGAQCTTTNAEGTDIECALGQLRAGQSHPPFQVFFQAPLKPAVPIPGHAVAFSGVTLYAEGTGGPTPVWSNSTQPWSVGGTVSLDAPSSVSVKSLVQRGGGVLFTGDGISTANDPFTTSVTVPASATFTTASITESPEGVNCTNFTACNVSQVTIPGEFSPYLTIVLRQDASTLQPGTKLGSVVVYYLADDAAAGTPYTPLGACASPTTPNEGALAGVPCIADSKHYKSRKVPGWTPELDGDFEWTLINKKNGGYKVL